MRQRGVAYARLMRVAAMYDIHGNLPALQAVLREIEPEGVDTIVVGGDVAWGPFPAETIDVLRNVEHAKLIRGNADREVARRLGVEDGLDDVTAAINEWVADQLMDDQREWLANLDMTFATKVHGLGPVLFCHGSPRSDEEVITPISPAQRLAEALRDVTPRIVVCGHTHMQFERDVGQHHVINAGSVGMPYEGRSGAYWALLGPRIELRTTDYDIDKAAKLMRGTGCPHVEEVFIDTILHPPSAADVARQFEAIAAGKAF